MVDVSKDAEKIETYPDEESPEKGCRADIGALPLALTLVLAPIAIKKKKK